MFLLNATKEVQTVRVHGNYITFPPEKVKLVDEDKGRFICMKRQEQGIVDLPQEYEDPEWRETPEGKAAIEAKKQFGLDNYINGLRKLIYNNQVSLRMDLEKANIKADPAAFASEGELNAMRLVAKYQKSKEDDAQKRVEEVRKLVETTGTGNR